MKIYLGAIVMAIATASPATADELLAVTPTGAAETVFAFAPREAISKVSAQCLNVHWNVISSTDSEVVCEAPLNTGQSIMGQFLLGNSYSTPPRRFFKFNAIQAANLTRVQASGWMELQMAFGQTRRTEFSGADFQNNIFGFMVSAGGQLPIGTRFPNYAFLGILGESYKIERGAAYRLKEVDTCSPAANAGLKVGDILEKVAGRSIKDDKSLHDALAKATKSPTYVIEASRDGKTASYVVSRAYRPDVAQISEISTAPPAPIAAHDAPQSTADELAKFAKLRADGVITEQEFQDQKRKLLGQ